MKPSDNEIEMLAAGFAIQHKNGLIRFAHALLEKYASARAIAFDAGTEAAEAPPVAYLTRDEEGSPSMLFFDVVEARGYCAPGEEPEPLFRHAGPQADSEPVGWFDTSMSSGTVRWRPGLTSSSFPEGHPFYAAPQASAEDVRNAALEALEAAQQFIRNGIEFGYIRMPGADTPDPAHRTPGLIDTAISALKTQADKDGGQQRAEDAERWRWATATDENAQMLYTIVQAYGGDQQKINERADFYRAALSAPQTEQGERDA